VWVVGEDAGIEVEALGWGPGPRSARWSDRPLDDVLASGSGGLARYRCTMVAIAPDGREVVADCTLDGSIADRARGDGGFGYDPIFVPDGDEWKSRNSARALAAAALREALWASGAPAAS